MGNWCSSLRLSCEEPLCVFAANATLTASPSLSLTPTADARHKITAITDTRIPTFGRAIAPG
ncbi:MULTISPECIES: hypothetical protein [Chroococcidiopsis]|uniref:hypothetical protein n=1 Tax=Chroococcidiopsis TaxID=54298 RepID=UPI0011B2590A|nr:MULTISPECIES: hypothetical protein [Chroococcidiopsis]URD49295.1 hypothetical protein M5J74_23600 [Chroococcidiopsis sp. CCNUC1]